jgi:hypothetical protein
MKRFVLGLVGLLSTTAISYAGEESFIQRPTRIKGCVAIIDEVRNGTMAPTEWLEQNKEEFRDLDLELKARRYPPAKAQDFLMGMAISICMEQKGYVNKCVVSRGEDGDVQMMATASIYACWTRKMAEPHEPPRPPEPPTPEPRWPPIAMSPDDLQQFNTDWSIITSRPAQFVGDNAGSQARFSECASYWQSLHYNRPPQVRQILYAVRVARCMTTHARGTSYAILPGRCSPMDFAAMLQPGCYARAL